MSHTDHVASQDDVTVEALEKRIGELAEMYVVAATNPDLTHAERTRELSRISWRILWRDRQLEQARRAAGAA